MRQPCDLLGQKHHTEPVGNKLDRGRRMIRRLQYPWGESDALAGLGQPFTRTRMGCADLAMKNCVARSARITSGFFANGCWPGGRRASYHAPRIRRAKRARRARGGGQRSRGRFCGRQVPEIVPRWSCRKGLGLQPGEVSETLLALPVAARSGYLPRSRYLGQSFLPDSFVGLRQRFRRTCASSFFESKRNRLPSSVSTILLFERSSSFTPISSSRLRTCRVSEGWASRSFSAAFVKLSASATATKYRRCRSSISSKYRAGHSQRLSRICREKMRILEGKRR